MIDVGTMLPLGPIFQPRLSPTLAFIPTRLYGDTITDIDSRRAIKPYYYTIVLDPIRRKVYNSDSVSLARTTKAVLDLLKDHHRYYDDDYR